MKTKIENKHAQPYTTMSMKHRSKKSQIVYDIGIGKDNNDELVLILVSALI